MGLSDWPGGADPQTAVVATYVAVFIFGLGVGVFFGGLACAL